MIILPRSKRELFEFFESIPEEQWARGPNHTDYRGRYCAHGLVAKYLLKLPVDEMDEGEVFLANESVLNPLGVPCTALWVANDFDGFSAKDGVLQFLERGRTTYQAPGLQ